MTSVERLALMGDRAQNSQQKGRSGGSWLRRVPLTAEIAARRVANWRINVLRKSHTYR